MNDAPVTVDDSYATDEDAPLTIGAPGVLSNDSDVDGDALSAILVSGPAHGTLVLNADGSFSYTPDSNFNGADEFHYKSNDGTVDGNEAVVSIEVRAVNDAPATEDDSYATDEDTPLTVDAPGVLSNDSDVDGDALSAILVSGPAHGTLVLNADGSFTYTPDSNFNGTDEFHYKSNDGTVDGNESVVSIEVRAVNDVPVATDDAYSTPEDTELVIAAPGVLVNDTDIEGDSLTAALVSGPSHGTLTLNSDGSFSYLPSTDFNGSDSFTYVANDGSGNSNTATVEIDVTPVNDPPVTEPETYDIDEDTELSVDAPGVLDNDSDVDGDVLSARLVSGPLFGTLEFHDDGSFVYTPNADFAGTDGFSYVADDGTEESDVEAVTIEVHAVNDAPRTRIDAYVTDEDTVLTVDAPGVLENDSDVEGDSLTASLGVAPSHGTLVFNSDGSFSYTPDANFFGVDGFTYFASDGELSTEESVTIEVKSVNDLPVASDDSYSTDEDSPLTIDAPGVLVNDSDLEGDSLTAVLVSDPAHGTVVLDSDGSFSYTPDANFHGDDSFTYVANDGSADSNEATVTITVAAVNDAPVADDEEYSLDEDSSLDVVVPGVLGNDSDIDGDTITAKLVDGPAHGSLTLNADGSFSYVPDKDFHGTDWFTYVADDGALESDLATVTLVVNAVNDSPVAADDEYSATAGIKLEVAAAGVLTNDSDVDGDALAASLVTGPAHGTFSLSVTGSFTYTADAGFSGDDSFTYQALDGALLSNVATVTIHVAAATNHRPVAKKDRYTTFVDTELHVAAKGVLENDTDADGDELTASLFSGPSNGSLVLNSDGSFHYTPNGGFEGRDSFVYRAHDGKVFSALTAVTIYVEAGDPLRLQGGAAGGDSANLLMSQLQSVLLLAGADLSRTFGAGTVSRMLANTTFVIQDLPSDLLGIAAGNRVIIDRNAAGAGWFFASATVTGPESGFVRNAAGKLQGSTPESASRVDLLSVVLHELGHRLGAGHHGPGDDDWMSERLATGVRRLSHADNVDAILGSRHWRF